jgi:protein-L-isoaspartate(D-aspartate) O-methyltransferase
MIVLYEPLGLDEGHKLLEIGLGSGYSVVVAREIVGDKGLVVCIEIDSYTFAEGQKLVLDSGYEDIVLVQGDGAAGYPEYAPYDRICLTAACPEVPPLLFSQLRTGGKLISPVIKDGAQKIILYEKGEAGISALPIQNGIYNIPYVRLQGKCGKDTSQE